jgi:hypothetical protein
LGEREVNDILTENHGPLIVSSTYWDSAIEEAGKVWISVNAGTIRILVPRVVRRIINDMRNAKYVILSRGPWPDKKLDDAIELLFEDGSDEPFCLHLSPESFDNLPGEPEVGREWALSVWDLKKGKPHKSVERKCHWRRVAKLPCLQPWEPAG